MAAATILDMKNFRISLAEKVQGRYALGLYRAKLPNFVKIRQSVVGYRDFSTFQDSGRRHFGFLNFGNFIG